MSALEEISAIVRQMRKQAAPSKALPVGVALSRQLSGK